jgi:hypothetical protein
MKSAATNDPAAIRSNSAKTTAMIRRIAAVNFSTCGFSCTSFAHSCLSGSVFMPSPLTALPSGEHVEVVVLPLAGREGSTGACIVCGRLHLQRNDMAYKYRGARASRVGFAHETKTHFAFRVDIWDDTGDSIVEHVTGVDDFEVAEATYRAAVARWPAARITLRQGARVVHDTGPRLFLTSSRRACAQTITQSKLHQSENDQ